MKKLKLVPANKSTVIAQAVKVLKQGGVIVYPTETAYGLGADFFNKQAVKKVYQIKGRNYKKPLSVIVSDLKMAKKIVKFNQVSFKLVKKYWPGPLTIIQKSKVKSQKYLGLRISSNKLATAIVKKFGKPITATSANVSGRGECYSITKVINQFRNKKYKPDLIIDAGALPKRKVSTVVKVIDGKIQILRKGKIKLK